MSAVVVGDRVAFSRAFLRSTGSFTGWRPFARGRVTAVEPFGAHDLCTIQWSKATTSKALGCNLVAVERLHLEPV